MKLFRHGRIIIIVLTIISFQGNMERTLAENGPIPMPGDDTLPMPGDAIPMPGDDVPMPGEESFPLPGEEPASATPMVGQSRSNFPFELRGYVENTSTIEYLERLEEERLLNVSRMRVDLAGEPNASLDFGIGVVGTMHQGATRVNVTNYFPGKVREQLVSGAEDLFTYQTESEKLFVQEAFGTLYTDRFRLRVGRHKFYTGTGYAYNPIDLLNAKNPMDPTYETDGLDALLLTVDLPNQTQLQGLVRYADRLKNSDYLLRLKTYLNGWDVALQYTHHRKERIDWETLNSEEALDDLMEGTPMDAYTRDFRRHLLGGEFAGEVFGFGVYGEGGYVLVEAPDEVGTLTDAAEDHERVMIGVDRTFDVQLYMMVEYLRFGQGASDNDELSLNDYMAVFGGEQIAMTQNTLFTGLSYPLSDFIEGSLYTIVNIDDGSGLMNPWIIYDIRPGLKLSISLNIPFGGQNGANGNAGASGFARLKLNF